MIFSSQPSHYIVKPSTAILDYIFKSQAVSSAIKTHADQLFIDNKTWKITSLLKCYSAFKRESSPKKKSVYFLTLLSFLFFCWAEWQYLFSYNESKWCQAKKYGWMDNKIQFNVSIAWIIIYNSGATVHHISYIQYSSFSPLWEIWMRLK